MRVLIFGGWGQLGIDLCAALGRRHEIHRPGRSLCDIRDGWSVHKQAEVIQPDVIINCAAYHNLQECEDLAEKAFSVNAVGSLNCALAARDVGSRYIYISTDYVFGGSNSYGSLYEDDHTAPLNVYGVSKAAGENLATYCPDHLIVRCSGLFGHYGAKSKGGNFVDKMLEKAGTKDKVKVVDDQIFSPTSTLDLADRITQYVENQVPPGIYHATNTGSTSWFGFARKIYSLAKLNVPIFPVATGPSEIRRPEYSVLIDTKSRELGLPLMRSWESALEDYLKGKDLDKYRARIPRPIASAMRGPVIYRS